MKVLNTVITLAMITIFTATGCASTNNSVSTTSKMSTNTVLQANTTQSSVQSMTSTSIKAGVTKLLSVANELKTEVTVGDSAKTQETGPKLEETWRTFEDAVKPKYPELYNKVEQYLNPTVAGSKATPIDKQTLAKLNDALIQVLNELSKKVQ